MNKNNLKDKSKKIFAVKWGFAQIFMFFFIGCIIGVYYEQFLTLFAKGIWESRKGVIYGPFNPIYGFGFMFFVWLLGKNNDKRKWYLTWLYSAIIGGVAEYLLSFIGEKLFNSVSWNYSDYFLNIGGRTTIPYMIFWGLGGLIFMKFVYPFICKLLQKLPYKPMKFILPILVVFMCLNMFVSYTALIRQAYRKKGEPAMTVLGEIYDQIYTDEYLYEIYPNMVHNE